MNLSKLMHGRFTCGDDVWLEWQAEPLRKILGDIVQRFATGTETGAEVKHVVIELSHRKLLNLGSDAPKPITVDDLFQLQQQIGLTPEEIKRLETEAFMLSDENNIS